MITINEWSENKLPEITSASISLAIAVDGFFEIMTAYREGMFQKTMRNAPPQDEWLSLYKNHRRVWNAFKRWIGSLNGPARELINYDDRLGQLINLAKPSRQTGLIPSEVINEAKTHVFETFPSMANILIESILNESKKTDQEKITADELGSLEVVFTIAVLLPSWLIFHQYPVIMLRKARQGNIDDIENLFRIDPTAQFEPKISRHYHNIRFQKNQNGYKRLLKALGSPVKKKLTIARFKICIAALISAITEYLGQRLNEPEIRSLFDVIANEKGLGDIDTDLPESPEAFSQAILRERKFWLPLLPDKK